MTDILQLQPLRAGTLFYDDTSTSLGASTIQAAIEALDTNSDAIADDVANLVTLSGVAVDSTDLGTFTGSTIGDNLTVKAALQSVETAYEETDTNVDDLVTLSGVAENSSDLGTFSGTVISDNGTIKAGIQELETYAENTRSLVQNFEFENSALDYVVDNTAVPATEVSGDRYVLSHDGGAPNAAYDGASAGDIVEFDGSVWVATTPTTGTLVSIDDETNSLRQWGGSSWDQKAFESTTASNGLTKVGVDVQLASSSAGAGLGFAAGVLSVNVDDTTLEVATDTLQVKADGINDTHIDFGTGANQVSAVDLPYDNTTSGLTATDTKSAIDEVEGRVDTLESATATGWQVIAANDTAVAGDRLAVDTSAAVRSITLPASPVAGDQVIIRDAKGTANTNNINILRNGNSIAGSAQDIEITVDGLEVKLVYIDGTYGWSVAAAS